MKTDIIASDGAENKKERSLISILGSIALLMSKEGSENPNIFPFKVYRRGEDRFFIVLAKSKDCAAMEANRIIYEHDFGSNFDQWMKATKEGTQLKFTANDAYIIDLD